MIIPVIPPKNVIIIPEVPAVSDVVNTVDLTALNDDLSSVTAVVIVANLPLVLTLWDATTTPTYEEIGDWTQAQANARIIELI